MSISRITYAISRDKILPYSAYWHKMGANQLPVRAQFLCLGLCILLLLPVIGSPIAFYALASTATIAVDTSYIIPILGKLTVGAKDFKPGEWNLGRFSVPLGIFVCVWISVLFVVLCLPQYYPVTAATFNFAPVMIGFITLLAFISWFAWGRKWFTGPQRLVSHEEAEAMEKRYREIHGGEPMPHDKLKEDHDVMEGVGAKA